MTVIRAELASVKQFPVSVGHRRDQVSGETSGRMVPAKKNSTF